MADMIGVLGGTFDPPHLGHLILAEEARYQLGLSRVLWVVSGQPPHKRGWPVTSLEHRLAMVGLAIEDNPGFEISRADIDRDPPHYAHGTLAWLQEQYPDGKLDFLMGSDSLHDLPTWDQPERFIDLAYRIVVMQRQPTNYDPSRALARFPGLEEKLKFIDAPLIDISGQAIRERVRRGGSIRYLTTENVSAYISQYGLYL